MQSYKNQAQSLINMGYAIVPINAGKKAPLIKDWQNKTFTADQVTTGVGVKCGLEGSRVCAIDIDIKDKDLAQRVSEYVQDTLGYTVERVGNAPKTLLVYRACEAGWAKVSSRKFGEARHQVEVLGAGQQFVAYAVHPDTGKPYEWVDFFGGLEVMGLDDLPVVTADQITQVIAAVETMILDAGYEPMTTGATAKPTSLSKKSDTDDFLADMPVGLSTGDINQYLEHLDPSDYDLWLKIGMAIHHETAGEGIDLWDTWSSQASNYAGYDDIVNRWASFADNKGANITAKTLIKLGNEANAKAEIELKKAVLDEYVEKINQTTDTHTLEQVAKQIGKDLNVDDFSLVNGVQSAIKEKWQKVSPTTITRPVINTMMGLKKSYGIEDVIKVRSFTEEGNANRLIRDQDGKIMYVAETDMWYLWTGNYWRKSSAVEIEQLARETVNNLVQDYMDMADGGIMGDDLDFLKKSFEAKMITNMVKFAKSDKQVLTHFEQLDGNHNLLGVGNGAIDLTTGKLHDPEPKDCITIASGVDYIAKADCPVWDQTLQDIFAGDDKVIHFVQKLIGYAVLGNPVESLFVIMYGDGSNGKSTFINTIRDVLGNHAKIANAETFLGTAANSSGAPREDILRLLGSRIVTITEPDEGGVLREGLVKAMTGGEALPARAAYGRTTVEVKPTWTAFMPTNHKPIIKGTDHGIWRRMMLIPFTVNFDNHPTIKKDPDRMEKLKAEHSGILAWIVNGALLYRKEGLKPPKKIDDTRNEYKDEMDLLSDWIKQDCVVGHGEVATNKELWKSWERYAKANGELKYISSSRVLSRRLASRFEIAKNIGKEKMRGFRGISVKISKDFEDESGKE